MAYVKRIPPIKMMLTINEYNTLIGVLTNNINEISDKDIKEIAISTKEKLLKYSIPHKLETQDIEIEMRLYLNEAADIISQVLIYTFTRSSVIDYYQVLLKVRENQECTGKKNAI